MQNSGKGLEQLTTKTLATGFQISDTNPMLGVDSRARLLRSLGASLLTHSNVFGKEGRPGNIVGAHHFPAQPSLYYLPSELTPPTRLHAR